MTRILQQNLLPNWRQLVLILGGFGYISPIPESLPNPVQILSRVYTKDEGQEKPASK